MASGQISIESFKQWLAGAGPLIVTEKVKHQVEELLPVDFQMVKNVKEAFFPAWEVLYRYRWADRAWTIDNETPVVENRTLLAHPCEIRSIDQVLDRVFLDGKYPEIFYRNRREATSVVVFACREPEETCFCRMVGGGPFQKPGGALLVVPVHAGLYLESEDPGCFSVFENAEPAGDERQAEIERIRLKAESLIKDPPLGKGVPQRLYEAFEDEVWEEIAWKCLNCGACTYLCPTCYCFDMVVDGRLHGQQIRSWDACMFPRFTLHASGHNPRPGFRERIRQRVLHKFSYFPIREGTYGCSGCGACIEVCPVNWDIRDAVKRMVSKIGECRCPSP
ncbi:MAG TPA: 4Fe-4S dicluster domain-containing protein [Atribacteraceae bacterium]|nr:4Fe-4S dicluster domain-containing protein [Atribacteraceae bacterium]